MRAFIAVRKKMDIYAQSLGVLNAGCLMPDQRRQAFFNAVVEAVEEELQRERAKKLILENANPDNYPSLVEWARRHGHS